MKIYSLPLLAASLLCVCPAFAIDRDAKMIDTAAVEFMELDDADGISVAAWGETAFDTDSQDWAVLVKGAYGRISPVDLGSINFWNLGVGLKYYLIPSTSLAVIGDYTRYDGSRDAKMGTLQGKHRFISATEKVSPYVTASIGIRDRSSFSDADVPVDSFSEALVTVGAGVEFRMNDVLSFVFDARYVEADESDDATEDLDGFTGFLGLQYYYFPEKY